MNIALAIVQFLVNEILSVPAFLIGIITAVGLAAMRKSVGQIAGAAIKATLGFLLIGAGAGLVVNSLGPLGKMIEGALGAQGVVPTNEAIAGIAQQQFGSQVAWIMLAGFLISLVLARITPLHYVFLTGHHMLFMATLITIVMASTSMPTSIVIGLGSLLLGVLMVSLPALAHPFTRKITGGEDIAIGHFGTSAYIAAAATGRLVDPHGKSQSTENIKVPEGLRFLRDSMVATALSMVLMYVVVAIIFLARRGEKAAFQTFSKPATGTGNYIMASVTQGLEFGIAVAVILFGVRIILGELIPAFQGIASKVVPGAIPALDCPIVFPYAQNAVLIGFISSFIGGLVGLTILATVLGPAWGLALILPGLVPHFFTGGAAGVYGNATGGRRGAVAGAFVNGLLVTFLPAFLLKVLGPFSSANTTFGDADFGWFGILIGYGARTGTFSGSIILALIGATILSSAILVQRRADGWDPAPARGSSSDGVTAVVTAEEVSDDPDEATRTATASTISHRRIAPPVGAPTPPSRDELGL